MSLPLLQPRSGIARRLIVQVILFSTVITLIISGIQLYRDYLHDLSLINTRMQQIEDANLKSLTNGLWVADAVELQTHLSGLLRLPDMQYLEISDHEKIWASVGEPQEKNIIAHIYPMIYDYRGQPQTIGTLKVVVSLNGVYERLIDQAVVILITNGIKTFLVSGFILFLFQSLVTRHLVKIAEFAREHDLDHLDRQLKLDRLDGHNREQDELGTVVTALNTMQENLQSSFTALTKSEAELKQHRNHLEELVVERTKAVEQQARIIDQIHDSVVSTDLDAIVTSWNKGAERLFGYTAKEAIGKHIAFVYPEEERIRLRDNVIKPLLEKGKQETEVKTRRKNGELFYVHLSLSLLHDEAGVIRGMIGYAMDITAHREAQREAERKTIDLEATNKELETFAYSVSHDLRAPLRSIEGFSRLVLEDYADRLDATGQDYLERIRAGALRMSQLIDDLLDLSRYTRVNLNPTDIDLTQLAHEIMAHLQQQHPERSATITIDPAMRAQGDKGLFKAVLENLLGNSWKYTGKTAHTEIEFRCREMEGEKVFYIRDNGAGFDMAYSNKLFGVFQRLHSNTEFPGLGVGLATVQRIIQRHGGRIWADAAVNNGATFYFTINDGLLS